MAYCTDGETCTAHLARRRGRGLGPDPFRVRADDPGRVRGAFQTLFNNPEPFLQQGVRIFTGDDTLFPGFQIVDGILSPTVLALFEKALELQVPHNVFSAWMATPPTRCRRPATRGPIGMARSAHPETRGVRPLAQVQNFGAI